MIPRVAGIGLALLALAGCDNRKCLHSHTQHGVALIMVGKVFLPMVTTYYVCDQYEGVG